MPLHFVTSKKGKQQLVHNGFVYTIDKKTTEKTIWKCVEYTKTKCLGRVWSTDDEIEYQNEKHNHTPDAVAINVRKAENTIKEKARTLTDAPQQILASVTSSMAQSVAGQLPCSSALKRNINNARKNGPSRSTDLLELVIPAEYTVTSKGDQFLLFDSGSSSDRILIFSTEKNLELMQKCDHWYADGTFKSAPKPFQQVFTIHGIKYDNVIPTIYALLTNKQKDTYIEVLKNIKLLKPGLNPKTIMTDFETAQISAFQEVFPGIESRGCFFHFCQCIWRQIQSESAIRSKYEDIDDPDFSLHIRELAALAFVPVDDVQTCFEKLTKTPFYEEHEQLLTPLLDYFENTWIGKIRRAGEGRLPPKFSLSLWNCTDATKNDLPKTNNAVEGWHNAFSSLLGAHHPTIWKFINGLRDQQSLNELKIEHYIAGNLPKKGRKKYRDTAARIKIIVEDYHGREMSDFLQGIAHNLKLQVT